MKDALQASLAQELPSAAYYVALDLGFVGDRPLRRKFPDLCRAIQEKIDAQNAVNIASMGRTLKAALDEEPPPSLSKVHLIALRLQVSWRITITEKYDFLVARTAKRFVLASHRLPEPAKDAEVQELPDLGEQREVALDPCVTTRRPPTPLPLNQFIHCVAAEHTNREAWPSQFDVLAKKAESRGLLKWLTARKGNAFHRLAGKNPFSDFVHLLITAAVELVAGQVPAARTTQITSLKPYHDPLSGAVHTASRHH